MNELSLDFRYFNKDAGKIFTTKEINFIIKLEYITPLF